MLSLCAQLHELDPDMVVDAVLLLWQRCKTALQRHQTGSVYKSRYLEKIECYPLVGAAALILKSKFVKYRIYLAL